jgi:hypothetical protein
VAVPSLKPGKHRSTGDVINELWALTREYAKQETIDPLKSIGKFLALGIPGSLLLGLGGFFIGLGIMRLLQEETGEHLTGSWDWVPYLASFAALVLAVVVLVAAIKRASRPTAAKTP